jgi:hypothetical protein
LDELVELGRAQDPHRDRPRQHLPFVRGLRGEEASREVVRSDDRNKHDSLDAGLRTNRLQVSRLGREERRGRILLGRGLSRRIDDGVHPGESLREPLSGNQVHPDGA